MKKTLFNKLVRDKIPEIIKNGGGLPHTKILEKFEYKRELFLKLREECEEVINSKNIKDLIGELADILEVINAIAKNNNISFKEIEKIKMHKKLTNGSFDKKIFLIYSETTG